MLALPFLPEPGTVDPDVEAIARSWDLSRLQLTNEGGLETNDLMMLINGVQDSCGRLVVTNKLQSRSSATLTVCVKYEAWPACSIDDLYIDPFLA